MAIEDLAEIYIGRGMVNWRKAKYENQKNNKNNSYHMIIKAISKMDCIHDKELQDYIDRVLKSMTEDQIADLEKSPYPYIVKIKEKVKALLAEHAEKTFDLWLSQDKIECVPNYKFPSSISPISVTTIIPKSLYTAEEDMNEQEINLVWELSALDNIKWWHRNIVFEQIF